VPGQSSLPSAIGKRLFDVALASAALILLAPVILVVGGLVAIVLGQPVLFRQTRPGLDGQPFEMIKFRTMTDAVGPDGSLLPDAQRLTPFGRFLRATSLDELPELINVLKGDMSLVGPRPLLMEYLDLYTPEQARRHEVRPGITGWAQVHGRNAISWEDKFALDLWYVEHQSFRLDLKILLLTLVQICKRGNISAPGHATMERFTGTQRRSS
jgi:lipopolysaccharide/colanic/teichoic acid biosynthesis glycosyltransferase